MNLLSHHVDTFKETLYLNGDFDKYNSFIDDLLSIKESAQQIHDVNNDNRFVVFPIKGVDWHVMATSISGYSVVLKNNDVSIGFRKKGNVLTDRNPQIKIEYRASFLVKNGLHGAHKIVNDFIKENIHTDYLSKVQEIHLACDTQGHSFNLFDIYRFKTRSRKIKAYDGDDGDIGRSMVFTSRKLETLYFGSSNNMMRIYNKTNETKIHPESGHVKQLWELSNNNYDENKDVWRIEFQTRKVNLQKLFNENRESFEYTKVLLDNVPALWDYFIKHFSYRDIKEDLAIDLIKGYWTTKEGNQKLFTKEAERKIFQRSEINPLWSLIEHFKGIVPPFWQRFTQVKRTEPVHAMNAVCGLVSTITKHYGDFTPENLEKAIVSAQTRSIKNHDMGLMDKALVKAGDYYNKVKRQELKGFDIIDIHKDFEENLGFHICSVISPLQDGSRHQPIF